MALQKTFIWLIVLVLSGTSLQAQYFGRNKVNYENHEFEVLESPNFRFYHYLENQDRMREFASRAERWYHMHQRVLNDTIVEKNPFILYNNHADFQQTNTISGAIGVGTGGVTEALKNRVVMPIAESHQQTNHVLGHELVHAFQYNMILNGDSTNLQSLGNLPLWMVEGMAEYMSIGRIDAHTAMWMRDAVLNDDVPTIKDLNNPKYFPYRYGQVFWAFLTGLQGDDIIEPFFISTAKYGMEEASKRELGVPLDTLSKIWVEGVKRQFGQFTAEGKKDRQVGRRMFSKENSGRINIAPEISPNGRYVIFLSEKDLFSIDLFLADARTGEVLRKVASSRRAGHIDDFAYIESSGTWSPDSERFAFVAFSKGRNILIIKDVTNGKTVEEIVPEGLQAFSNPEWSPDGNHIVVSGLVDGQPDLFQINLRDNSVEQLTNDTYSELHPSYAPDGRFIVFSTDRLSFEQGRRNGRWSFNLATLDPVSRRVENIDVFPGADNMNPIVNTQGNILFLSNRDGFRNMYEYNMGTGKVYQLTDLITGVSGITAYAPAISVARRRDRIMYTYFSQNGYSIYRAQPEDFLNREVPADAVDFSAATLPKFNKRATSIVDAQLDQLPPAMELPETAFSVHPYRAEFKLDYVGGSAGVGLGTSNAFGTQTGVAGGIDFLFSDILGDNQLFASAALNGEITDFGGAIAYINRDKQLNWGASLSHVPFRNFAFGNRGITNVDVNGDVFPVFADTFFVRRIFEDKATLFATYPFSSTMRIEGSASFARYSTRLDQYVNLYQTDGFFLGPQLGQEREKLDTPPGFNLWSAGTALVGDNAAFGIVGPLQGHRYRFGITQYAGEFNYAQATLDYRRYRYFNDLNFGLAFRALHYGRYGQGAEDIFPLFVGGGWFVRGFNNASSSEILNRNGRSIDELFGSRIAVSNFEVRIPFTGPRRLALIKSGIIFSELTLFADAGVAWYDFDQFDGPLYRRDSEGEILINPTTGEQLIERMGAEPIISTGVSLRVNLFGALIVEPYYAFPLARDTRGSFGLNLVPAW